MPVSASDILRDADLFRRSYPDWPHAAPVTTTDNAEAGTFPAGEERAG